MLKWFMKKEIKNEHRKGLGVGDKLSRADEILTGALESVEVACEMEKNK